MDSQEGPGFAVCLTCRAGDQADAQQLAATMAGILQEIEAALSPIIGPGGVVALYKRSLHLAGASHPWLVDSLKQSAVGLDLASLETAFAAQSAASAAVAGAALLQTFHQLLVSLIGPSLTERLLRGVWENSSNGPFAQDTSP